MSAYLSILPGTETVRFNFFTNEVKLPDVMKTGGQAK